MMAAPAPRSENIEIPSRPAAVSDSDSAQLTRKRVLRYGGIAAAALLILVLFALLRLGSEDVARLPADAPLIKAEEQPIKVAPSSPGGMQAPNRDILVYERLQGTPAGKGARESLLPESEEPLRPPASPDAAETAFTPDPTETDLFTSDGSGADTLLLPPAPEPPTRRSTAPDVPAPSDITAPSQAVALPKLSPAPSTSTPDTAAAPAKMRSSPAAPTRTKVATAPSTEALPTRSERPAGGGFQVQLLSSRSVDDAKGAWARLRDKNADVLGPLSPNVARVNLDNRGTFYRLRAGPIASEARARSICDSLAARRVSCLVVRSSS